MAETDEWDAAAELPPLPPLPDGGLSVSMPAWLRVVPGEPEPLASSATGAPTSADEPIATLPAAAIRDLENVNTVAAADALEAPPGVAASADQPLGPQADPRTFLRDEDFPRWIQELPALPPRRVVPVTVLPQQAMNPAALTVSPAPQEPSHTPLPEPVPPAQPGTETAPLAAAAPAEPAPAPAPAAAPAVTTSSTERQRERWETPLLVILVVGIILAVIWALLINGLIGNVL